MTSLYRLARPAIFRLDPETAHELSILALKCGLVPRRDVPVDSRLRTRVAGIDFPNPLGLAAGYDKNAEVPDAVLRLGFGFVEVGTLTPLPQTGNERPRLFRLPEAKAIINRLGFNNQGHARALERMRQRLGHPGIVGVNVGANKDSPDRVADYCDGVARFAPVASYLTINISSPNTPGLRDLQTGSELDRLLRSVVSARDGLAAVSATPLTPVFLKVAPDLTGEQIGHIARTAASRGVDGVIVSNTTLSRRGIETSPQAGQAGGLSGRPLFAISTYALAAFRKALGPDVPLIGVGGVESVDTLVAKIEAGADLVQLYTAMIYQGPELPARLLEGLLAYMKRHGYDRTAEMRDRRVEEILARGSPVDEGST